MIKHLDKWRSSERKWSFTYKHNSMENTWKGRCSTCSIWPKNHPKIGAPTKTILDSVWPQESSWYKLSQYLQALTVRTAGRPCLPGPTNRMAADLLHSPCRGQLAMLVITLAGLMIRYIHVYANQCVMQKGSVNTNVHSHFDLQPRYELCVWPFIYKAPCRRIQWILPQVVLFSGETLSYCVEMAYLTTCAKNYSI